MRRQYPLYSGKDERCLGPSRDYSEPEAEHATSSFPTTTLYAADLTSHLLISGQYDGSTPFSRVDEAKARSDEGPKTPALADLQQSYSSSMREVGFGGTR